MKQLFLALLLSTATVALANEVYRVTDEDGNTFYTNIKPAAQGQETEKLEIRQTNISAETPDLPLPPDNEPKNTIQTPETGENNGGTNNTQPDTPPQQKKPQ